MDILANFCIRLVDVPILIWLFLLFYADYFCAQHGFDLETSFRKSLYHIEIDHV